MVSFLDLPVELILHSLWFLDLADVLSCQLSHRLLYTIIKDSILLDYLSALKAAGMEDNRLCSVGTMHERLRMLNRRENAWAARSAKFFRTIPVPEDLKLEYYRGISGGMHFFIDSDRCSLYYFSLPPKVSDEIRWNRIDVGNGDTISDVDIAIYDQDLIAIIVRRYGYGTPVQIHPFESSTGNPHRLAQNPKISTSRYPPYLAIKVAGDHLALVTSGMTRDYLEVYEWKTGVLKMRATAPKGSYSGCLFLSPKVLLLPNKLDNTFEFWDIPELPHLETRTCAYGALELPPMTPGCNIEQVICKREPYFGSYGAKYSSLPFYASPTDAIAIFDIEFSSGLLFIRMFVHHRSLLDLHSMCLSSPPTPEESSAGVMYVIPWDKWGPTATRILTIPSLNVFDSAGINQRYAFSDSEPTNIVVWDFNPIRIQSLEEELSEQDDDEDEDVPYSIITEESRLDHICFEEPVISRLPYAQHIFEGPDEFDEVAADDEWLVEFRYEDEMIVELEFLHIGKLKKSKLARKPKSVAN